MNLSKYHLPVTIFLIINPLLTLILSVWYYFEFGFQWNIFIFALVFAALTNLSITVGYHRLFAHRSYETYGIVRFLLLVIGTSAWQGSALKWASDHRIHHQKIDTELDPYNINRGFWHAHMGWLFLHETIDLPINAPDLQQDAMLRFQDRYYIPLAIFCGYFMPAIITGLAFGDFFGGLIVAGGLRIALTQQSTFFINSLCHYIGSRPYNTAISARDSWLMALLTHGEGYHNFHHAFQSDYRNGIKWYHWDPTKWTIFCLACIGAAKNLKTIPMEAILRARLQVDASIIAKRGRFTDTLKRLKDNILIAQKQLAKLTGEYGWIKSEYREKKRQAARDFQIRKQALGTAYQFKKEELQAEYRRIIQEITDRKDQRILQVQRDIKITKIELSGMLEQWNAYRSFA